MAIAIFAALVLIPVVFILSKTDPQKRIGCGCGCATCKNREICHGKGSAGRGQEGKLDHKGRR